MPSPSIPTDSLPSSLHQPVLLQEVLQFLAPERGGLFVDATLGLGGHSEALLKINPKIELIGIDQDEEALALARTRLGERVTYLYGNFAQIASLVEKPAQGILMDIGVSSFQLDTAERGFSFNANGPLDMRMNNSAILTAAQIVNSWPERQLADLIYEYGEEHLSRKIAKAIVETRKKEPFQDTRSLSELIASQYPMKTRFRHLHPATRTFQALRIAVNDELEVLKEGLEGALSLLAPGGRLAVITFHSLEDRIVKHRFRRATEEGFSVLTKKPVIASEEEEKNNPRSRSAKLRVVEKIG